MVDGDKNGIRRDENGDPIFVITFNVKKFCHQEVLEQTPDGDVVQLKMMPTGPFLTELNKRVVDIVEASIMRAREDNRTKMGPEDVPQLRA